MSSENTKKIWDLPTRLFHWLLLTSIGFAYYSVEFSGNMDHHFYAGYTVLTLIIFRIIWGFVGTALYFSARQTARKSEGNQEYAHP